MEELKLEQFLTYRFLSSPDFSPDGKRAAFVVSDCVEEDNCYESRLYLWENGAVRQLTDLGAERSFFWEDGTHLLFPAVRSRQEKKRAESGDRFTAFYRLDVTGGEALPAFTLPFAAGRLEVLGNGRYLAVGTMDAGCPDYHKLTKEEREAYIKEKKDNGDYEVLDEIPFWANGGGFCNKQRQALFLCDGEKITRITEPLEDLGDFAVLGEKVYYTSETYAQKPEFASAIWAYDLKTGEKNCLAKPAKMMFRCFFRVGQQLLAAVSYGKRYGLNENAGIYRFDPETGALTLLHEEDESLYSSVGSDCRLGGGKSWGTDGKSLYHLTTRWGNSHLYRLDLDGTSTPVLTKDGSIDCIAVSGDTVLMVAMYDMKLQELYRLDPATGAVTCQSHLNEDCLKDVYVAAPKRLTLESRGCEIEGWVLEPKDYDSTKTYPGVLDIHGGPKTAYGPVFYHEMQLWANRGYFVFFCNPKGSDGRGNAFMDIRGAYGHTDYENIMDFTDAVLARYPRIDRTRLAVTGGSYGGFMTNWIIGHTDRFACAASQRSISNWLSFYGVSDIGTYFAGDQCDGDIYDSPEKLWELSPLKYAAQVKTPTLFIHSDEDYRCPLEQGLQMYTAISNRGVPARLCMFRGENHELSRSGKPKHRIRRLTEITDWIEKYTK